MLMNQGFSCTCQVQCGESGISLHLFCDGMSLVMHIGDQAAISIEIANFIPIQHRMIDGANMML